MNGKVMDDAGAVIYVGEAVNKIPAKKEKSQKFQKQTLKSPITSSPIRPVPVSKDFLPSPMHQLTTEIHGMYCCSVVIPFAHYSN